MYVNENSSLSLSLHTLKPYYINIHYHSNRNRQFFRQKAKVAARPAICSRSLPGKIGPAIFPPVILPETQNLGPENGLHHFHKYG